MRNESYQVITPETHQSAPYGESMTFNTQLSRDRYIREQRAYGWEVFLSFIGKNGSDELYGITRRALS